MRNVERLAARIAELEKQVRVLSSAPQLAWSSVEDGAIDHTITHPTEEVTPEGETVYVTTLAARFGLQEDGSSTVAVFDGPKPPRPVAPTVTGGPGFLGVAWSGQFEDRPQPYLDHDYVAVHASQQEGFTPHEGTLVGTIRSTSGEVLAVPISEGTWFVSLVAVAQSGRWSDPAPFTTGEPGTASGVDVTAREMAQAAQAAADAAREAVALADNAATRADRLAAESKALADAVSAAANVADARAIEALAFGTTSFTAADGKTRVTYSLNPPGTAVGAEGDTWFQIDKAGVVVGFWECSAGDAAVTVPEATAVTPAAPEYGETEVVVPATRGVTYLMNARPVAPGTYGGGGPVAVVATAEPGFVLAAGARTAWVGTLEDAPEAPPLVEVTPAAPEFVDAAGTAADRIVIPDVEGVAYWLGTARLAPGEHPATGTVTVTATPEPGYTFPDGAVSSWPWTFATTRTQATPIEPTFDDANGASNDRVIIPEVEGVAYRIDGAPAAAGAHPATGTVKVTAVAAGDAFVLTPGAATAWTLTFDPNAYVTPTGPTWKTASYVIPTETGVKYLVGGVEATAGEYAVSTGGGLSTTTFDGLPDGAAWPSPWLRAWGRTAGCVADVRGGKGRMRVQDGGSWADKVFVRAERQRADVELDYEIGMNASGDTWHHVILRAQAANQEPSSCYDILFNRNDVKIMAVENWSGSVIGQTTAVGMPLGATSRVKVRHIGQAIQVKVWPAGQTEPDAWTVEATNTRWTSGYYGFLMVGGSQAAGYEHMIDNLTVRDPAGGSTTTIDVTAAPVGGWLFSPGAQASWSKTFGG